MYTCDERRLAIELEALQDVVARQARVHSVALLHLPADAVCVYERLAHGIFREIKDQRSASPRNIFARSTLKCTLCTHLRMMMLTPSRKGVATTSTRSSFLMASLNFRISVPSSSLSSVYGRPCH